MYGWCLLCPLYPLLSGTDSLILIFPSQFLHCQGAWECTLKGPQQRYFAQGKEQYTVEVRSEIFITTLYFLNKIIQHTFEFTRRYIAFFAVLLPPQTTRGMQPATAHNTMALKGAWMRFLPVTWRGVESSEACFVVKPCIWSHKAFFIS